MISLHSRGHPERVTETIVGVVQWVRDGDVLGVYSQRFGASSDSREPTAVVRRAECSLPVAWESLDLPTVTLATAIQPLADGDVVAIHPSGRVDTMFRGGSAHNSLFVTEQCNSDCIMCSQPPRPIDDIAHFLTLNVRTLRLMPPDVAVLGITGGEPTLLGEQLGELLRLAQQLLPAAQIDVLSNGRRLSDWALATTLTADCGPRVLFTIPLHADNALSHDYIVQSVGAFDETVRGLYHLAALGVRVELRVVMHRASAGRLPHLARFIQKNLPFVEQVAFMGLEVTGLARANQDVLWIDPPEYAPLLQEAVAHLTDFGLRASIYNLPRCLTPEALWPFLRQSISDWKRDFVEECTTCHERADCGGLFGTSHRLSPAIRAL